MIMPIVFDPCVHDFSYLVKVIMWSTYHTIVIVAYICVSYIEPELIVEYAIKPNNKMVLFYMCVLEYYISLIKVS